MSELGNLIREKFGIDEVQEFTGECFSHQYVTDEAVILSFTHCSDNIWAFIEFDPHTRELFRGVGLTPLEAYNNRRSFE